MSKLFYKIGKTAYSKPWAFIVSWLLILGVIITVIATNGVHMSSETRIEGTEAQDVLDKLAEEFPVVSGGQGSYIFEVPDGEQVDGPENAASLASAINKIYELNYVVNPLDLIEESGGMAQLQEMQSQLAQVQESDVSYRPFVLNEMPIPGVKISEEGNIALLQFQLTEQVESLTEDEIQQLNDLAIEAEEDTSITVIPTGTLQGTDIPIGGTHEIIGLVIAGIILIVTLGSLVAAGLPLIVALIGVGVGVGGTFALSSVFEINSLTPTLALMIGLAVGIDYALFIVNRQRKLIIEEGLSAKEAASRALGTAGSAVFFAGLTVIIALCGMLVIGISFLSSMALVASMTVFIDVLVALTLLPSLLGLIGEKIVSAKSRKKASNKEKAKPSFASHWINGIIKFKWLVALLVVVILGTMAIPVGEMNLGMPSGASANKDTAVRQSYDLISENFGEGYNGTLLLVAEDKDGNPINPQEYIQVLSNISQLDSTVEVSPGGFNGEGTIGIMSITPAEGPTDEETNDLVHYLRTDDSILENTNLEIGVTGLTAINIDISEKLAEVFPYYIGIIVVLSLVILLVVFRSVIVPIKATLGFLLSIMATFGVTTAVFQWGWFGSLFGIDTGGPLLSFIPIMVTGILYGLAMDYQVFLVSSMRESYIHGQKGDKAVISGYTIASKVVVAAALIMVSVFSGFIFTEDIMIKQIGFALAFGILIDAFLIRMIFVPAVMSMFGDKVWWLPKWLDKLLPNLDIEGEKLIEELSKDAKKEKAKR
ncbi:MMPL family transporter [Rossellomorea vietnamensis]|uniref:MMPL family transporter n=1 Tax=Rossellomorea vietnamensis TaxID=218284 RepID=A0A5D4NSH3_9BACI|nr:MMPL family transporter [Rossellomorea vietnamensis]TYS16561.1 MMPL family transporter [Rossellomorea vietnamensis]